MQTDVKCPQCGTLFGKEITLHSDDDPVNTYREDAILTIKNRDLYRSYKGGKVWGPCRGCGVTVRWPDSNEE